MNAYAAKRGHGRGELRSQRLAHVKTFISGRLDDASLDVPSIARQTYVSSRTLLRLFASEGTTPMRWLWAERLDASRRALEQGKFVRVTDAAFAFGFKDASHFSRVFKAAYGLSPRQVLTVALPVSSPSTAGISSAAAPAQVRPHASR